MCINIRLYKVIVSFFELPIDESPFPKSTIILYVKKKSRRPESIQGNTMAKDRIGKQEMEGGKKPQESRVTY